MHSPLPDVKWSAGSIRITSQTVRAEAFLVQDTGIHNAAGQEIINVFVTQRGNLNSLCASPGNA